MRHRITRRELLERSLGAAVAIGVGGCATDPFGASQGSRAGRSVGRFRHGVASGDPLYDRVILWTRIDPGARDRNESFDVEWVIARDEALQEVATSGVVLATAARDYTVKVDAAGLEPGRSWYYGFRCAGEPSPIGRTRTSPRGPVGRFRAAVVCCANHTEGHFAVYGHLARRRGLDCVIHLGDYIYESGDDAGVGATIGRARPEPDHELVTLDDYRARYAQYRRDPDLQALHRAHPMIAVWDDHEIANNAWKGGIPGDADPERFPARRAAATRAYLEWMPIREQGERIHRSFRYGDLVDLFMLDTRLHGRDAHARRDDRSDLERPDRSILGADQEAWLLAGLDRSEGDGIAWRLVGQQVVFAPFTAPGSRPNRDAWDGYPANRERILRHLASHAIDDVVVLSGDVHASFAFDIPDRATPAREARPGEPRAVELVTPAVSSMPPGVHPGEVARFERNARGLPHVRLMDLHHRGCVLLDVTPERLVSEWHWADTVARPGGQLSLGATRIVLRGANRISEDPDRQTSYPAASSGRPKRSDTARFIDRK